MKFGERLDQEASKSLPEWAPFWINYRRLKQQVKAMSPVGTTEVRAAEKATSVAALKGCVGEVEFFRILDMEIKKSSSFFTTVEKQFRLRIKNLQLAFQFTRSLEGNRRLLEQEAVHALTRTMELKQQQQEKKMKGEGGGGGGRGGGGGGGGGREEWGGEEQQQAGPQQVSTEEDTVWIAVARACAEVFRDALRLEHWIVMTYYAYSKILKKHDRWTGYMTRAKYMQRVVDIQPFTQYQQMLTLTKETQALFEEVLGHLKEDCPYRNGLEQVVENAKQVGLGAYRDLGVKDLSQLALEAGTQFQDEDSPQSHPPQQQQQQQQQRKPVGAVAVAEVQASENEDVRVKEEEGDEEGTGERCSRGQGSGSKHADRPAKKLKTSAGGGGGPLASDLVR